MIYSTKIFYSAWGNDESGNASSNKNEDEKGSSEQNPKGKEDGKKNKSIFQKIRKALQDWSNKDEQDFEYDDTKV